jgi:hypothetical protein
LQANIADTEHAAAQVEGAVKQAVSIDTTPASDRASTIACYTKASTQLIDDLAGFATFN